MAYTRRGFKGGAKATTLNGALNDSAGTVPCSDISTWAGATTNGVSSATISRGLSDEEVVTFAGISASSLTTVLRGQGGTTAQAHASGATIELTSQVTDFDEANAHIADTTLDHHTQYARTNGSRAITGAATFNSTVTASGRILASGADLATTGAGGTPRLYMKVTDAPANGKVWDFVPGNTTLLGRLLNDAENSVTTWLTVTRSGSSFVSAVLAGVTIDANANVFIGTPITNITGNSWLGIANAANVPFTTPAGGGMLFAQGGALKWLGSAGTLTTIATA